MNKASRPHAITIILFAATVLAAVPTWAFITSDEEIWRADIDEGKRRAQDFKEHIRRERQAEAEREQSAGEFSGERFARQQQYEKLRSEYISERDARPDEGLERERLEKQYEAERATREREMEIQRRAYVVNRALVREVLAREAYIDEMLENELVKSPETK